jgi:hypothetical protein
MKPVFTPGRGGVNAIQKQHVSSMLSCISIDSMMLFKLTNGLVAIVGYLSFKLD